jgi:hypothetical protein
MITEPHDWLLIRATKDGSPLLTRLRRIWCARCALPTRYHNDPVLDEPIAHRLILILEQFDRRRHTMMDLLKSASPDEAWKIGLKPEDPYWSRVVCALASVIRLTMVADIPNYRSPSRFRKDA